MNDLIEQVAQKTGLSADKARTAVETVLSHLKTILPAPLAGQIDSALSGEGASNALGEVGKKLGGLFGK
jgi:hypothetical protein